MVDYDLVGDQWVPYLMKFDRPNRSLPSVTTGDWGFRNVVDKNGAIVSVKNVDEVALSAPIGVVLGSSAAFGVGATHDRNTIPSLLNRTTNTVWLNFGGRALNSTQELILLSLHLPRRVDRIVVFSGVNNLTLAFLSANPSPVYNSFFFQSVFENAMQHPASEHVGIRRAAGYLLEEVRYKFRTSANAPARTSLGNAYNDILSCFSRDVRILKAIADGIGATIHFALQPLATWLAKKASQEEGQIFAILDKMSMDWQVLARYLGEYRDRYFSDVARICAEHSIPFYNMNLAPEFESSEWLFVDRVHLSDRGYELSAILLNRQFSL